ncbi:Ribonuclease [bacterium HR40]|nr:Ribonuclease [bacterium HR40]
MTTSVTFHGGVGTVTGSCFLVAHGATRFLVDCGLFQGTRTLRELNARPFPFDPRDLDFVLVTHAHIDHSGLLPKLVRHGFHRPIWTTAATADLLGFMLPDSAHIQKSEVDQLNRRNRRRGRPEVEPIYTEQDAERTLGHLQPIAYGDWLEPAPGIRVRYWNAGHILGSASIEVELENEPRPLRLLFSGDLGPDETAFHDRPAAPSGVDYLFLESTYGDRDRQDTTVEERRAHLVREVRAGLAAGGNVLIPAFAVERTQEVLYALVLAMHRGELPKVPIFIDSPLAVRITSVFEKYANSLHEVEHPELLFKSSYIRFVQSVEESMALNRITGGAIVMAASGMCDAGRIRHHLRHHLWRPEATVLFVGYQAPGTLGRILLEGADRVRIHGHAVAVRARIRSLDSFSAHADRSELLAWAKARLPVSQAVFLTHGDPTALEALRDGLVGAGFEPDGILVPELDERFALGIDGPVRHRLPARLSPELVRAREDWHNAYARTVLSLEEKLRALPSDREREELLARIRAALEGDSRGSGG